MLCSIGIRIWVTKVARRNIVPCLNTDPATLEPNEENRWWLDNPGEGILYDSAASSNSRC